MTLWDWLGWAAVAVAAWRLWPLWYGFLRHRRLDEQAPLGEGRAGPTVSIIVPARDEGAMVEQALQSLLEIDYPALEIVAVNDRSRDDTGTVMDRVAGGDPRCRVVHVRELPGGWLGKNHANMLGARAATGDILLFTDGDVVMKPPVLRRAVRYMDEHRADHLVVFPETPPAGFWQAVLMDYFVLIFGIMTRYPLARWRRFRRAYIGVGAFNMIRRSAYEAIGTHERLRLEVADDLMLGKLVKEAGLSQHVLDGEGLVWVRWQTGLRGMIQGLEKNAFAGARYSVTVAVAGILAQLLSATVPFVLAITGPAQVPAILLCAMGVGTYAGFAKVRGDSLAVALFLPVAGLLMAYVIARSTYVALRRGGITWRDTFYPLAELRRGMV